MYGENTVSLRAELTTLLQQHRIQQRIGGAGIHTVPMTTTTAERDEIGKQIRRYRHGVLLWCRQAVAAASPIVAIDPSAGRSRRPAGELHGRLEQALNGSDAGLAAIVELATAHQFDLVDTWRNAARAAALGEHDFTAGVEYVHLDLRQATTVINDAAEVAQALVVLDNRYSNIPGWQSLIGQGHLGRAAANCSASTRIDDPDYTVDRRGWHPPPTLIEGPARPGVSGVVQAQHNLLNHLNRFPTALNLKRIIDSQRDLSNQLAGHAAQVAPRLSAKWRIRAQTYTRLFVEARNVGGTLGDGGGAAAEGAFATSRLRSVTTEAPIDSRALFALDKLGDGIDSRLVDIFDHGVTKRLYFIKARLPRVDDRDGNLIHGVRERFTPITSPVHSDLVGIVHEHLRPRPAQPTPPAGAARSRYAFREAIEHRPEGRGSGPAVSI